MSSAHDVAVWLFAGFALGFFGSVPVAGPIAALVLSRSLQGQDRFALGAAAGGAVAEAGYAGLAFCGLAWLAHDFPEVQRLAFAAAGFILMGLATVFWRSRVAPLGEQTSAASELAPSALRWGSGFGLGLTITALNPTLLGTWSAACGVLFAGRWVAQDASGAGLFAIGAALGVYAWFAALVGLIRRHRQRMNEFHVFALIRAMALLLGGCGAWFLVKAWTE